MDKDVEQRRAEIREEISDQTGVDDERTSREALLEAMARGGFRPLDQDQAHSPS